VSGPAFTLRGGTILGRNLSGDALNDDDDRGGRR
jgi:hypothetical protein